MLIIIHVIQSNIIRTSYQRVPARVSNGFIFPIVVRYGSVVYFLLVATIEWLCADILLYVHVWTVIPSRSSMYRQQLIYICLGLHIIYSPTTTITTTVRLYNNLYCGIISTFRKINSQTKYNGFLYMYLV